MWRKLLFWAVVLALLPMSALGYDPLAGVRSDVARIMDPTTSEQELDAISARNRRWTQMHQGGVAAQEMRTHSQVWQYQQLQRQARERAQYDAAREQARAQRAADQADWLLRNYAR